MYKSQIEQHLEDDIVKAIQNYEIQADKDERIKTMNYDRNQYENKGGAGMTVKEIIDGLKFTIDMFLFDPSTGKTYTEPKNDMDKTTIDACKGAIELLEQQPCEDCISRQAVLEYIEGSEAELGHSSENELVCKDIKALPSVTPQPKTGKWIDDKCSICGKGILDLIDSREWYENERPNFCPFCGMKIEAESEAEE